MARLQHTETKWAKSFPTEVPPSLSIYTCTYERGSKSCKKTFTRKCDLRRHQLNHTRPSKCTQCARGFPSQKDVERHTNSVHNNTTKYFCPHDWCRDARKPEVEEWFIWGFRRKDHWLKHLRAEHGATSEELSELRGKKEGCPMAILKEGTWRAI